IPIVNTGNDLALGVERLGRDAIVEGLYASETEPRVVRLSREGVRTGRTAASVQARGVGLTDVIAGKGPDHQAVLTAAGGVTNATIVVDAVDNVLCPWIVRKLVGVDWLHRILRHAAQREATPGREAS